MCNHVALILDGNRRWGKVNGVPLRLAYKKGAKALQQIILYFIRLKIPYATFYGFSYENWSRSCYEIHVVMYSFLSFLEENLAFFVENNIKVSFVGDLSCFDSNVYAVLKNLEFVTKLHTAICIQLAVSYSGRKEIEYAAQKSALLGIPFKECLWTSSSWPDPDFLIRTGGFCRLSNFLLWQLAYTEFFFLDKLWPDFTELDFDEIFRQYQTVQRKHGV